MKREATKRKFFKLSEKPVKNPYVGFTTFQHFRNDALYSDIVVKPENNATETEERECYPVPSDVEQNGYNEGFYPDCSIAYIRILWKEFEPERKKYNFELIESILKTAKDNGQTVMFRLMPHSTRASDDVPEWLKKLISCPERPAGQRVKDSPQDPVYLEYFGEAVEKIAERFDSDPVLDIIDVSITGAWGEGSNWEKYPEEALKRLMDVYTKSFKHTHLIGQVAAPWLIDYGRKTKPVGWRGDGVGESRHLYDFYPTANLSLSECWKTAPVAFESYWWLCEWERQGWSIDDVIDKTLSWHISNFNAKSMPIPHKWKDKIDYWLSKMGYHFVLRVFKYPHEAQQGDTLELSLYIENRGCAPIYNKIPVKFRLTNGVNEYNFDTEIDVRKWLPGDSIENLSIKLSDAMKKGTYNIQLGIFGDTTPVILLETAAEMDGNYYKLSEIKII